MTSRFLALGLFVLAAVVAAVWFTWRPPAPQRAAEVPDRTATERAADPRLELARPDGPAVPDARSTRAAGENPQGETPPDDSAADRAGESATASVHVEPGVPTSVDQVTDETRAFAEKYRKVGPEERRAALIELESVIAERVEADEGDPPGKYGPSLADLKAEAEWLRMHPEG